MKVLFIDRDGTLIEEPADQQVDALDKLRLVAGVIPALIELARHGYRFVMVSNQDGLGTASFPEPDFDGPHKLMLQIFESQGIRFDEVFICPHLPSDGCECRKPRAGLLTRYLAANAIDLAASAVIGDRQTDLELAERVGVRGLLVGGEDGHSWAEIVETLTAGDRVARIRRETKETRIELSVNLDTSSPGRISTGIGFFDHMLEQVSKHGGFRLDVDSAGDLEVDEHHTVEDIGIALGTALRQALGDKLGIGRYGFVLPMDESRALVAIDLSGRGAFRFDGSWPRDQVGQLSTEMVEHFFRSLAESLGHRDGRAFLPLAGREPRRRRSYRGIRREHASHGRGLLQGCRTRAQAGCERHGRRAADDERCALMSIAIIDSGGANIASLVYAFERIGHKAALTTDPGIIRTASHVLLPGVGAASDAMQRLRAAGLVDIIRGLTQPVLGICLGMQLLAEASEEEDVECLGIIPGVVGKL